MGLRNWGALFFAVVWAFLAGPPVPAQSLGAEIQGLEKNLENPGLSAAERRNTLTRLAGLRELSGDFEAAAGAWREAAGGPGGPDDLSLIREARCLAAIGEWDRAAAALKTVLLARRPGPALLRARYTAALIEALSAGEFSALEALAGDPDFAALRPAAYYTLWKAQGPAGGGETWKTRLLREFPRSPEGLIAASEGAAPGTGAVNAAPAPMWLLPPGREGPGFSRPAAVPAAAAPAAPASVPAAPGSAPAAAAVPGSAASAPRGSVLLQTGLFGGEGNARKQADQLRAAGFSPLVVRRRVKDAEYWAVGVSPDPERNLGKRLKDAGFESFPVNLE